MTFSIIVPFPAPLGPQITTGLGSLEADPASSELIVLRFLWVVVGDDTDGVERAERYEEAEDILPRTASDEEEEDAEKEAELPPTKDRCCGSRIPALFGMQLRGRALRISLADAQA